MSSLFQAVVASIKATGASVFRTLADRFADRVNVLDFGAVGDNTVDCTSAFQAAIAAAQASGKELYFPPCSPGYKVTDSLPISSQAGRLSVKGAGRILASFAAPKDLFVIGTSGQNPVYGAVIEFEGLYVSGGPNVGKVINSWRTPVRINGAVIDTCTHAFYADTESQMGYDHMLSQCKFLNCSVAAVTGKNRAFNGAVLDRVHVYNSGKAFVVDGADNFQLLGCHATACGTVFDLTNVLALSLFGGYYEGNTTLWSVTGSVTAALVTGTWFGAHTNAPSFSGFDMARVDFCSLFSVDFVKGTGTNIVIGPNNKLNSASLPNSELTTDAAKRVRGEFHLNGTNQAYTASAAAKVLLNTAGFNDGLTFDGVTNNRATVPYAGKYRIHGSVFFVSGTSGQNVKVDLRKTGTSVKGFQAPITSDGNGSVAFSAVVSLAANDYLELFVSSAANTTVWGASANTFLCIEYLGP